MKLTCSNQTQALSKLLPNNFLNESIIFQNLSKWLKTWIRGEAVASVGVVEAEVWMVLEFCRKSIWDYYLEVRPCLDLKAAGELLATTLEQCSAIL